MSRSRLPGPACATCRAKSRRCDRGRPACNRCISKDLDCGGYPERFRFCGIASRGRWKGQEMPTVDNTEHLLSEGPTEMSNAEALSPLRENDTVPCMSSIDGNNDLMEDSQHASVFLIEGESSGLGTEKSQMHLLAPRSNQYQPQGILKSLDTEPDSIPVDNSAAHDVRPDGLLDGGLNEHLSPEPRPDGLQVIIDEVLIREQNQLLLSHYDSVICRHQIQQYPDDATNPYRKFILPLAYEQPGLLYAILGLSASHLGRLTSDTYMYETIAVEYRSKALRALANAITNGISEKLDKDRRDAIFATIQILLLHDISESGISNNGIHISGAVSICCKSFEEQGLEKGDERATFLLGNLVWLDIIRAFAQPERLCFPKDLRERIVSLSDQKLEMINGCPRDVMLVMGETLDRAKAFAHWQINQSEYHQAVRAAIRKLYKWNSLQAIRPNDDPYWLSVSEAFRNACILRCLRLLDATQSAEDPEIQESVTAILDAVSEIREDSCLIELMVLPLFMAGADALSSYSQHYVLLRCLEIEKRSEMPNRVARDLLERVWEERRQRPKHDHSNVPWMKFTHNPAPGRQHDFLII